MREPSPVRPPLVGIIANPISARDIRRVIANANSLQLADRVNIVLRLLAALAAGGVGRVLMMPDREGLRVMLQRHLMRAQGPDATLAAVEYLDMPVTGSVDDTLRAAHMMREAGVAAIVVLGGDGTHRAVVCECGDVPIVGLSTGTNNAFPEMREPTITGLATGLFASGRIPARYALASNKRLEVTIREPNGTVRHDIALVDAVISREQYIGARAVWKTDTLTAVYVSFASPQAIGLSAIAGLLEPVGRDERGGLAIELGRRGRCAFELMAPIAPGLMQPVPIAYWHRLEHAVPQRVQQHAGIVALDGEREMAFGKHDEVFVTLHENAFSSIDVAACMSYAAGAHLMRSGTGTGPGAGLPVPEFRTFTPQT
ncbi:MAG: acetoin catabolism protein X [Paraburkholderia sp.]|uniref:ATP-NAD kinase family protein n=1 Tax=Paraburkholderia sp. TaxID=1926495 RepID=UPI0011FE46A0|nr:NAD(+)/NADH kinase [Paraburkholderia sp.]TAM01671.1 MAG: acetoin catabolism protein X [Paraburkholderia sp.]TAM29913.1 MAG: acetoin catabolism protein X [Paraburkholderia sp.]